MKVGFTGTRAGMTREQKAAVDACLICLKPIEFAYHGGCVGADIDFDNMFVVSSTVVVVYPSNIKSMQGNWSRSDIVRPEMPPLIRNRIIVNCSDIMLATPKGEEVIHSGTWAAIRYARSIKKPLIIIWPTGLITKENE